MPRDEISFLNAYNGSEDLQSILSYLGSAVADPDQITGASVHARDGDYVDIALTASSQPYSIHAEFELVMADGEIVPADDRRYARLQDIIDQRVAHHNARAQNEPRPSAATDLPAPL